jgi:hypothetical protein
VTTSHDERWHLSCDTCGHWKVAHVTRDDVAAWFRTHPRPRCRQVPDDDGTEDRESICPCPCGTPYDAEKVRAARAAQRPRG